jgi:hypothetical protein
MSALSYSLPVGGTLEQVTAGVLAPAALGTVEIRFDQSPNAITDAQSPTGTRAVKKGEIYALIRTLEQYLIKDPSVAQ